MVYEMDMNYIKNGYIVCKSIGDVINCKQPTYIKCETSDDVKCRIAFLKAHNLFTLYDFTVKNQDCVEFLGEDKHQKLSLMLSKAVFKQLKYDLMSDNISNLLSTNKVKHLILKGTELKKYYPENIVRTSNDIDIYVRKNEIKNACRVLTEDGFVYENTGDGNNFIFKKEPRYYIELHTGLEGFNKYQESILTGLADKAINVSATRYALSDDDCYIYCLFHLYKHFVLSGAGVRMFLDTYLIRKNAALDFDYIIPILKKLKIDGFESAVCDINRCLFEGADACDDIKNVIEFIFDSGTFGKTSNSRHLNKINSKISYQSKLDKAYTVSFSSMKKRYPILKTLPFLYPFSFIHRFFHGIIHKRDVIKNLNINKKPISSDKADKYEAIFKTVKIDIKNR